LQRQLGTDRGPGGEPSRIDFELHDLVMIFEVFASRWDELPEFIPGRPDYRVLIARGVLVRAYSVYAGLTVDDVVELLSLEIDTSWPDGPDDDAENGDRLTSTAAKYGNAPVVQRGSAAPSEVRPCSARLGDAGRVVCRQGLGVRVPSPPPQVTAMPVS
jgi:hypothetical protein